MIKLIFMFKRKPGLTHEQFRHHYETSHVPLVHKYLSHLFVDYRRSLRVATFPFTGCRS